MQCADGTQDSLQCLPMPAVLLCAFTLHLSTFVFQLSCLTALLLTQSNFHLVSNLILKPGNTRLNKCDSGVLLNQCIIKGHADPIRACYNITYG